MSLLSTFSRFAHNAGQEALAAEFFEKSEDELCLQIQRGEWDSIPMTFKQIRATLCAQGLDPLFKGMILPERAKQ
jgi:hypothetical protein